MTLHELYDQVCRNLEAGEPVPLDLIAGLQAEGYVFPKVHHSYDEEEDGDDDMEKIGVSPNEVTISFVDYTHDTDVEVKVDEDGDFWLTANDGVTEILLSPAGAKRLLEILADALNVYVDV